MACFSRGLRTKFLNKCPGICDYKCSASCSMLDALFLQPFVRSSVPLCCQKFMANNIFAWQKTHTAHSKWQTTCSESQARHLNKPMSGGCRISLFLRDLGDRIGWETRSRMAIETHFSSRNTFSCFK